MTGRVSRDYHYARWQKQLATMPTIDTSAVLATFATVRELTLANITAPTGCVIVNFQAQYWTENGEYLQIPRAPQWSITHFAPGVTDRCTGGQGATPEIALADLIAKLATTETA